MENGMLQPRTASEADATDYYACRDQIEQQIIRAYLQLMVLDGLGGSRTVTLAQLSGLEVRLTELPRTGQPDLPPFCLEIHSLATGPRVDSFGCFEFDDELEAAVEFVCKAKQCHQVPN
jgi:hypothetical protein